MPGSQVYNSIPRMGENDTRKRCRSAKENWESQKTDAMKREELKNVGQEFSGEILATIEDQWVWYGETKEEWSSGRISRKEPWEHLGAGYQGPPPGAKVIVPGASSLSWTTADPGSDATDKEKNSNRQQAPIDWAASAEQDRGAVMGILGGRK